MQLSDSCFFPSTNPTSFPSLSRRLQYTGLPRWLSNKESACNAGNAGDEGLIPGSRGGNGNPLQYSCLEKSMDRGIWQAIIDTQPLQYLITEPTNLGEYSPSQHSPSHCVQAGLSPVCPKLT